MFDHCFELLYDKSSGKVFLIKDTEGFACDIRAKQTCFLIRDGGYLRRQSVSLHHCPRYLCMIYDSLVKIFTMQFVRMSLNSITFNFVKCIGLKCFLWLNLLPFNADVFLLVIGFVITLAWQAIRSDWSSKTAAKIIFKNNYVAKS